MSAVPSMPTPTATRVRPLALTLAPDTVLAKALLVVGGVLLTALSAQLVIPMWPAPITGQTLAVLVVGAALGPRLGALSMLAYLAVAGAGLPFFAEGESGWAYLLGPTVGYLLAFPIAAAVVGRLAERRLDRSTRTAVVVFAIGVAIILAGGIIGFVATLDYGLGEAIVAQGPYLPGEVLKGAVAALALPLAWSATSDRG